jgi:hypothetical protein
MSSPELMILFCLPPHVSPLQACCPSQIDSRGTLCYVWHSLAAVQVGLQGCSESFTMVGMELDTACQVLLQLHLGKHLLQHDQQRQVMYFNQGLCELIEH